MILKLEIQCYSSRGTYLCTFDVVVQIGLLKPSDKGSTDEILRPDWLSQSMWKPWPKDQRTKSEKVQGLASSRRGAKPLARRSAASGSPGLVGLGPGRFGVDGRGWTDGGGPMPR